MTLQYAVVVGCFAMAHPIGAAALAARISWSGVGYQAGAAQQSMPAAKPASDTLVGDSASVVSPRGDTALPAPIIWLAEDYPLIRARISELRGTGGPYPIVRSTSSLLWTGNSPDGVRGLQPELQIVRNSAIPFSQNHGGLWGGHGGNVRLIGGAYAKFGLLRIVFAPEIDNSQNAPIPPRNEGIIPSPPIPVGRSEFSYPWYANGPYSLDMPLRFGNRPQHQLRAGQSSILADLGHLTFGFSTENEWWGPGIDNALILSNNAPGFPHFTFRSSRPLGTRLGDFKFSWLVGALKESSYFDESVDDNKRSIAGAVVVLKPKRVPGLSVGAARTVIGTATGSGQFALRWLDVLRNTGHPNDGAPYDSTLHPGGRDQMYSIFARWVLPASGAEIYGEWGRLDLPKNLRDLLVQSNRGQAYTMGLQWTRQAFSSNSFFQLRIENTSLEQSLAQTNRFAGVWYTSRRVLQGFTNEGQVLGAAIGPGSSAQVAEANYFAKRGFFGIEFGRSRFNEDVHQATPMLEYLRWCSHDIDLQWGVHGAISSRLGTLSIRSLYQDRLNAYFQSGHGCPRSEAMVDIRNNNLTITFSPLAHW